MSKPKTVIMAPYITVSGYGSHSRDIISALIKSDLYDITLVPMNWGNTPQNALNENNPMHKKMLELTMKEPMEEQPDLFVHITIPLEFKKIGRKNIGITAGIETDRVSPDWLAKGNQMDMLIFPSKHSKATYVDTQYEYRQSQNGPVTGRLVNTARTEVLFEGVDINLYKPYDSDKEGKSEIFEPLYNMPEEFAFLFVGHWMQGEFRADRKDVSGLIYNFLNTFPHKKGEVALVLKTSGAGFSLLDRVSIEKRIESIRKQFPDRENQPNIYLVHGNLTDKEVNELYNIPKIKAMVSLTHGEGYGRPLAEFSTATGKPVLATSWSGQLDFLSVGGKDLLIDYELKEIPKSAVWDKVLIEGSRWAVVKDVDVTKKLNQCYYSYGTLLESAKKVQKQILEHRTLEKMNQKLIKLVEEIKPPQRLNLTMPQSNTLDLSKLKKLK